MAKRVQSVTTSVTAKYVLRRTDTIGNPAAESDLTYLKSCFVDNQGYLEHVRNCEDERGIIVGRTGAGKTALMQMLQVREKRVIPLNPHDLALGYIANSPVLRFFESLDINMDVFYRALWRHVFVVNILKKYFDLQSEQDTVNPWDYFRYRILRKRAHLDGLEYVQKRSNEFWNTTEELIREITVSAESELKASVDVGLQHFVALGAEGARRLTTEQRNVIRQLGQNVVSQIQMSKLAALFNALDEEILTDEQKHYYIMVDSLDENWVDDTARYQLIRALIETMREFNSKVTNAKVVIALRVDLLDRVLGNTTDSGFQSDKYEAICLPISWTPDTLVAVLDRRINQLIASRYSSSQHIKIQDILPPVVGVARERVADYIVNRTLMRPRDVIAFFNVCIQQSEGQLPVTTQQLYDAEFNYSRGRLQSLMDEWSVPYPHLRTLTELLMRRPSSFGLSDISHDELSALSDQIAYLTNPKPGEDLALCWRHAEAKLDDERFRQGIAMILYRVGLVGLKVEPHLSTAWSGQSLSRIQPGDIAEGTKLCVHMMFWRALGINPS